MGIRSLSNRSCEPESKQWGKVSESVLNSGSAPRNAQWGLRYEATALIRARTRAQSTDSGPEFLEAHPGAAALQKSPPKGKSHF